LRFWSLVVFSNPDLADELAVWLPRTPGMLPRTNMKKFVARQPIFDTRMRIYGYELLFRAGLEPYFRCADPDLATSSVVVDGFLLFGMKTLTGGRRAFVNFTRTLLIND
jgi:hypothetical protein